jgi:hypothetical protein
MSRQIACDDVTEDPELELTGAAALAGRSTR